MPAALTPEINSSVQPADKDLPEVDLDYGDDAAPDARAVAQAFAELDRLVLAAERATREREAAELVLKRCQAVEERLLTKEIPTLLEGMRMKKCTTRSGVDVVLEQKIRASLPGHERIEARAGAVKWLIEHGHGGVVKNTVRVDLERGMDERADALVMLLREQGFDPQTFKDVHAGTLSKLVRELMEEGRVVPRDLFSVFDQKTVKLTRKE